MLCGMMSYCVKLTSLYLALPRFVNCLYPCYTCIVHSKLHYCNYLYGTITSLSLNYPVSRRSRTSAVVKPPKSCHITSILRSLHRLRITDRIEYKLLSLTYKGLTTTQPPYLHNLNISVQRPCSNRSSSVVYLARPNIILSKNN